MSAPGRKRVSAKSLDASIFDVAAAWADARSKDPRTRVGACVYDPCSGGMFLGYNGFPAGVEDLEARWEAPAKYDYVVHAEVNAILKALRALSHGLHDCRMYVTLQPCRHCMGVIIQSGLRDVRYLVARPDAVSEQMAREASVSVMQYTDKEAT